MAKTNTIITIGRQFGSAGREIGRVIAKHLDIKLYDKEKKNCRVINSRCEESGGQEHEIRERYQFRWLFISVCA